MAAGPQVYVLYAAEIDLVDLACLEEAGIVGRTGEQDGAMSADPTARGGPLQGVRVLDLAAFDAQRGPCYRCLYPEMDEAAATCAEAGILAPVVGVVGALAATEALKILSGVGEPLVGKLWLWEAMAGMMRTLSVRRDEGCAVCSLRDR